MQVADDSNDDDTPPTDSSNEPLIDIFALIARRNWEGVKCLAETDEQIVRIQQKNPPDGQYPLHALCCIGAAPIDLISYIAKLYPAAIAHAERRYGDTCLHMLCRNAQLFSGHQKLAVLLQHTSPETIGIRNLLGGTALHSAANHNAVLHALEILIERYPPILNIQTLERRHVLDILFAGFLGTIHGHMHVVKILNQNDDRTSTELWPKSSIFDRFWNKVRLLTLSAFFQSDRSSHLPHGIPRKFIADHFDNDKYLIHGMLLCGDVPDKLLHLALKQVGETAVLTQDAYGNTPLHYYLRVTHGRTSKSGSYHRNRIHHYLKPAAGIRNHQHFLPMHIAIRERFRYESFWGILLSPTIRPEDMDDPVTCLPPALLAACMGGKEAINTCFCFLINNPNQIKQR